MKLTQFNLNRTKANVTYPIVINPNAEWIPLTGLFSNEIWKYTNYTSRPLSKLHILSERDSFLSYRKNCNRTKLNLNVSPHMWLEQISQSSIKILWALVIHRNYIDQQIGSLLTCGKLIPEYTQLHVRSEFSYYKYKSPSLRRCFIKKIKTKAEDEGVKIYERNDFKDMFLNFTDHINTIKELKQVKQLIINELQETE